MQEAILANEAKHELAKKSEDQRCQALFALAEKLESSTAIILEENAKDLELAKRNNLSSAMVDRLKLTADSIKLMIQGVQEIAKQSTVVGEITDEKIRDDGLVIQKQRIPLGVIGMIFESRPNVVIDCAALAIKSGNCIILKGGKEADHSNKCLANLVRESIQNIIPQNTVQLIASREEVSKLLEQVGLVDVIIPRGGEKLIEYVYHHSKVPVIAHFKGLCHIFIDESADLKSSHEIVLNAKTQRPGVCNAMETLLFHQNICDDFLIKLFEELIKKHVELRVCSLTKKRLAQLNLHEAKESDWDEEYLDMILSIKMVKDIDQAIEHIQKHGSHHTEAILSKNHDNIQKFQNLIDASAIMINASTRFNDGGQFGLGAELGISTSKLHAYGPMGAREMTTERYVVIGSGHIRN